MNHPEFTLHCDVARFLDLALPTDAAWTTIGHGPHLSKTQAGKLKAMGVKRGWPDIIAVHPGTGQFVAMELKAPGGALSMDQKAVHASLMNARVPISVCRSVEQVEQFLRAWNFPLKATCLSKAA